MNTNVSVFTVWSITEKDNTVGNQTEGAGGSHKWKAWPNLTGSIFLRYLLGAKGYMDII